MRVLVFSDTHNDINLCIKALKSMGKVDAIIHLGDLLRDADDLSCLYPDIPVHSICGNCDGPIGKFEDKVEFDGVKIYYTHGHLYREKTASKRAESFGCTVALFGHTHISSINTYDGILTVNPGSATLPRGGTKRSFAVIETENNIPSCVIVDWL